MIRKAAYGITAALAVGVVIVELLHASTLLIFALTSLASRTAFRTSLRP